MNDIKKTSFRSTCVHVCTVQYVLPHVADNIVFTVSYIRRKKFGSVYSSKILAR